MLRHCFTTLRHPLRGPRRQQRAYAPLPALDLWPVLAGTIPWGIDIAGSNLDVFCEVAPADTPRFAELLQRQG